MLIFEEQLIVDIPEAFRMMTIDRIDGMYPCDEKPQIILEDEETHRFCTAGGICDPAYFKNCDQFVSFFIVRRCGAFEL